MEGRKKGTVRGKIIAIMLICWLVPVGLMIAVMGFYVGSHHGETTAMNYHDQAEFNARICMDRLDSAVTASRKATYDGVIIDAADRYEEEDWTLATAQKRCQEYLTSVYQDNDAISAAILWMPEEDGEAGEQDGSAAVYNEKAGGTYTRIRNYWRSDHEQVRALAGGLDTKIGFYEGNQNLYMVRNMLDRNYVIRAVLVLILNREYCFDSLLKYPSEDGICVWLNDLQLLLRERKGMDEEDWSALFEGVTLPVNVKTVAINTEKKENQQENSSRSAYYRWNHDRLFVNAGAGGTGYKFRVNMGIDDSVSMYPFIGYREVLTAMVLLLIPLLLVILRVFRKEVTEPIGQLSSCAGKIEQGQLGARVEQEAPNKEFAYLDNSVNSMSENLKRQFDRIYEEEIALREARIMALQFHINPHFMNNTLEIINWEARLSGNEKVSRMIEALSVMMDGAMDRSKRRLVSLKEEMRYVDAYLYIMKERLGDKLVTENHLPEEYMDCMVPRLILQPVIENAIEHGVVIEGRGTVTLEGQKNGDYLYLDVYNDGELTKEDQEKIACLLAPDYITANERATNLGIANVNQRLRIMFGGECGLAIREENGRVLARLTLPWKIQEQDPAVEQK